MKESILIFLAAFISAPSLLGQPGDFVGNDFRKADSIAALYPKHPVTDLYSLSLKLTNTLETDQEKFRSIYKWVCHNIENDYSLYRRNQRQRERLKDPEALAKWNQEMIQTVFEALRVKHKTVCTGYAYLVRELCHHAGITCEIVDGYGRNAIANVGGTGRPNHSWNAVRLQNKWYLCDPTWSSGAIDLANKSFISNYDDSYFLTDPGLFVRNHYPLDSTWMLLGKKPTLHEFLNRPLIYAPAFDFEITELLPETFEVSVKKKQMISLQFRMRRDQVIETVKLHISGPSGVSTVTPAHKENDGSHTINHAFDSRGKHIVQVLLNEKFVFCYRVVVN